MRREAEFAFLKKYADASFTVEKKYSLKLE